MIDEAQEFHLVCGQPEGSRGRCQRAANFNFRRADTQAKL